MPGLVGERAGEKTEATTILIHQQKRNSFKLMGC